MTQFTDRSSSGCLLDIRDVFRQRLPSESTGKEPVKGSGGVQARVHSTGRSAYVYKVVHFTDALSTELIDWIHRLSIVAIHVHSIILTAAGQHTDTGV